MPKKSDPYSLEENTPCVDGGGGAVQCAAGSDIH